MNTMLPWSNLIYTNLWGRSLRQFVRSIHSGREYGSSITKIGKLRGADPVLKCPSDIDVVGINEADKTAVIGECKFRNRSFGKEECETLMDRARLLAPYRIEKYLMFSLGGYSDWVVEYAQNDSTVVLVSIGSLYSGAF